MIGNLETVISIVMLVLAWILLSSVIKARTPFSRTVKTTIVVLLFATLILRFSHDLTHWLVQHMGNH